MIKDLGTIGCGGITISFRGLRLAELERVCGAVWQKVHLIVMIDMKIRGSEGRRKLTLRLGKLNLADWSVKPMSCTANSVA